MLVLVGPDASGQLLGARSRNRGVTRCWLLARTRRAGAGYYSTEGVALTQDRTLRTL